MKRLVLAMNPFTSLYYFFERYVKEEYGLTHGEVKYAWEKYKDIIITS